jgi:hypothetical protein
MGTSASGGCGSTTPPTRTGRGCATAVAKDGFDEAKVRTVSENAQTLKFDQSGFEDE